LWARAGWARAGWARAGWALPLVVAAVLGGWRLTGPSLWADELATWGAVRLSWAQLWDLSGSVDAVLTPYYAMMKAYAAVAGTSTAALRLPAVVAVVATTGVVTLLGRRVSAGTGLTAGLLFAILPVTSRYAQEARPYAFVMLCAALAALCLIRLREEPTTGRVLGYAGVVLAAGLVHPLSCLLMLGGHAVAVARWQAGHRTQWRTTLLWATAATVAALPAVLLLALGTRQLTQVSWIERLGLNAFQAVPAGVFLSASAGGLVLALAVLGVRHRPELVALACAAFVPTVLLLVSGTLAEVWVARYVVGTVPAFAVLAAAAAARFGGPSATAVLVLAGVLPGGRRHRPPLPARRRRRVSRHPPQHPVGAARHLRTLSDRPAPARRAAHGGTALRRAAPRPGVPRRGLPGHATADLGDPDGQRRRPAEGHGPGQAGPHQGELSQRATLAVSAARRRPAGAHTVA
jgi:hypothetical protein